MPIAYEKLEIKKLQEILKDKHIKITANGIKEKIATIENSQEIFPPYQQQALLLQLLHNYKNSKKKEIILLDELNKTSLPVTVVLGALAEDWPGMSNSILGIVHHKERNVLFIKGFTVNYKKKIIGIVILAFNINTREEYEQFLLEKKELEKKIREASRGSASKYLLLEDEAVKFEIYNDVVKMIRKIYQKKDIERIIGEDGEALKFIASRSREYLEERKIKDLANLIIDNHCYQSMVRSGAKDEVISIMNFFTKYEKLTGITLVCREHLISIEEFLKTFNFIVPGFIIKHHKSFVTSDGILVYRIEIVDSYEKPLKSSVIKAIEESLEKIVLTSYTKKFSQIKTIGGFEHYARAIIPFLMDELKKTRLTQVFINVDKKTDFSLTIKLIIVSHKTKKKMFFDLVPRLENLVGVEIISTIPPKIYSEDVEVDILKLNIDLSEFTSVKDIFVKLKKILGDIYGQVRDFDEGFREIDIKVLSDLLEKLPLINSLLIRDVFFSFDELYRIEVPFEILYNCVNLTAKVIEQSNREPGKKILFRYKNLLSLNRTIFVISFTGRVQFFNKFLSALKDVELYFSKLEWNQRTYLIMVLNKYKKCLDKEFTWNFKEKLK